MKYASSAEIPHDEIFMTTHTGQKFYHFRPTLESICLFDVTKGLSQNCRYNGQTPFHYSVLQHSIYCEDVLMQMYPNSDKKMRRTALAHDFSETWLPDVHSALKHKLTGYRELEQEISKLVAEKFDLHYPEPAIVKLVDGMLLSTELILLMKAQPHIQAPVPDFKIKRMRPVEVEIEFLKRWEAVRES